MATEWEEIAKRQDGVFFLIKKKKGENEAENKVEGFNQASFPAAGHGEHIKPQPC